MKNNIDEEQLLAKAKQKVKQVQIFYLHLVLYAIVVGLLLYNFYIIEEGPYKNNIIALNLSVLVVWTVFIIIHRINVFNGRKIFKKSWEEKKIQEFLEDENETETTTWE
ncbi:2TM domain-containing protein [uncultured Winogradskyella sp.]|uniref:2TM domain-containing protein n=1 Tax=uncultured Winogradskyella sp. TaxID=395353 RepID=UPI00261DBD9D|nr:2TM domain-containing protein [uncultured Winogradskyella sp.]